MGLHVSGRLALPPLPARVRVVSDQFLLLRVHRDDRAPRGQRPADLRVDVLELRVAVGMIRAFLGLPGPLQPVVHRAQKLRDLLMADRMLLARELRRQRPCALAGPTQRRLRVTPRQRLHQGVQRSRQLGVAHHERATAPAGPPDSSRRHRSLRQLADALGDGDAGQATGAADPRDPPIALLHGLVRRQHSPAALIQVPPDSCELSLEHLGCSDARTVACSHDDPESLYIYVRLEPRFILSEPTSQVKAVLRIQRRQGLGLLHTSPLTWISTEGSLPNRRRPPPGGGHR
jgi:hypothetical protein